VILRERKKKFVLEHEGAVLMICRDKKVIKHFVKEYRNERNDPRQKSLPNKQAANGVGLDRLDGSGDSSDDHKPLEDGGS
jgi:hypothetical protein